MTEKIIAFIERHVERGADSFALHRVGANAGEEGSWSVKDSGSPDEMAVAIEDAAREAQEESPERIKFVLYSYREEVRGGALPISNPRNVTSLVAAGGLNALQAYGPEAGAVVAALVQSQTHAEHYHRLTTVSLARSMDSLLEENRDLRRQVRMLNARARKEAAEREEFQQRKHERALEMKRENAREERRDKIVAKVLPLLPAVASKFIGRPDKNGPMGMALQAFGDSLTDEQMDRIYSVLTTEQRIAIGIVLDKQAKKSPEGGGSAAPATETKTEPAPDAEKKGA